MTDIITADQARAIQNASDSKINDLLKNISTNISERASAGENYYICQIPEAIDFKPCNSAMPSPNPLQFKLLRRLHELLFSCDLVEFGAKFRPRPFSDEYIHYGLKISW